MAVGLLGKLGGVSLVLSKIRCLYPLSQIAIVASAPSALRYEDKGYQATIAVNGGGQLLTRTKGKRYFFSADLLAPFQAWYSKIPEDAIQILRTLSAVFSPVIYSEESQRILAVRYVEEYIYLRGLDNLFHHPDKLETGSKLLSEWFRNLPSAHPLHREVSKHFPIANEHIVFATDPNAEINPSMLELRSGATSSGGALQIAFLMGASEIHLYGVEFTNEGKPYQADNYFYSDGSGWGGHTDDGQRLAMEILIESVQAHGVRVFHHGPTKLKNLTIYD